MNATPGTTIRVADKASLLAALAYAVEGLTAGVAVNLVPMQGQPLAIVLGNVALAELPATKVKARKAGEPPDLKAVHRVILRAATAEPVKARTLIGRTPYRYNSNSRQAISDLCKAGLLVRYADNRYGLPK